MAKMYYKYIALDNINKKGLSQSEFVQEEEELTGTWSARGWHPCGTALVLMDTEHCLARSPAQLRVPTCSPSALRQRSLLLWPLQPSCSCRVWQLDCIPAPCQSMAWLPEGCCWQQAPTLAMKWSFINNHSWVWITFSVFDFFYLTMLVQIFDRFLFYNLDCTVSPWWLLDQLHPREACKKNSQTNYCKFGKN